MSCHLTYIYKLPATRCVFTAAKMYACDTQHPTMMQFMQQVRANLAQQDQETNEGPSDWSEPVNYNCLTPVSNSFAQEIRQSLQNLTGQQGFPLPYPVALKQGDLAKLSKFDYRAIVCRGELRMALCFLQVGDRKTVTVLVSENLMVVRVRMGKVPYGVFRGSVFSGYASASANGSAEFVISDCLYYRGRNVARRPLSERLDACVQCVDEATKEVTDSGFRLSVTPTWNAQDEGFWTSLEEDDSWTSILFVPASLAIKTGTVQSTFFEHSGVDFKDVANALTESIARPDLLDDCRGTGSWAADIPDEAALVKHGEQAGHGVTAVPYAPGLTRVSVTKTYSQVITDGVDPAQKPAGENEGGPAPAGDVVPSS